MMWPFFKLQFVSVLFFSVSIMVYWIFNITGALPNPEEWFEYSNHGPWRWELPGFLILWPYMALIPVTLFVGIKNSIERKGITTLKYWFITLAIQCVFVGMQLKYLYWTID